MPIARTPIALDSYRPLGRSGLRVSPLCLGTMTFGGATPEEEAGRIVAKAADAGANFIDTADIYNDGRSEEIVGRAIRGRRHHWVLATKVGNPRGPGPNERGLSRAWIARAIDESLRRLGTDHVDIYYLHREDPGTPLDETVRILADLVRQGKIRHVGVSNHKSWRLAELVRLSREAGIDPPVVAQPYYNAFNRMPEVELLPACAHFGLGVAPYSPLARGVLSGKYAPDRPPPEATRAGRGDRRILETEWRPESLALAQTIKEHAEAKGTTAARFALAWLLNNRLVTAPIAGPRTEAQWDEYVAALGYRFDAEDEALVDRLVPPGHPSTPGYSDPSYPVEGRRPWTAPS